MAHFVNPSKRRDALRRTMALKWIGMDFRRNVVNITSEKNSSGRILTIPNKLAVMSDELAKLNDTVFRRIIQKTFQTPLG